MPRANKRLATLAHAMSSTQATAPGQVRAQRTSSTSQSAYRVTRALIAGVVLAEPFLGIAGNGDQAVLGVPPRDARRQPAEDGEVVLVVLGLLFRSKRDGHPQGAVVGEIVEGQRHHADDHVRAVVRRIVRPTTDGTAAKRCTKKP